MKFHVVGGPMDGEALEMARPMDVVECPVIEGVPDAIAPKGTFVPYNELKTDKYRLEHFACRGGRRVGYYRHESVDGQESGVQLFERAIDALDELQTLRAELAKAKAEVVRIRGQRDCVARLLQVTGPERFRGRADIPSHVVSIAIDVMDQIAQEQEATE